MAVNPNVGTVGEELSIDDKVHAEADAVVISRRDGNSRASFVVDGVIDVTVVGNVEVLLNSTDSSSTADPL